MRSAITKAVERIDDKEIADDLLAACQESGVKFFWPREVQVTFCDFDPVTGELIEKDEPQTGRYVGRMDEDGDTIELIEADEPDAGKLP